MLFVSNICLVDTPSFERLGEMLVHPLKQEREARGWSQARLAEVPGTPPRSITRWGQGQAFPYPHYREHLCTLFGKNAHDLGLLLDEDISPMVSAPEQAEE